MTEFLLVLDCCFDSEIVGNVQIVRTEGSAAPENRETGSYKSNEPGIR